MLDTRMHKLIMKKVATYKCEDYKAIQKIDRKTKKGKKEYQKCLDKLCISILDFFYTMRIKSSYKDFAFIDGVDPSVRRFTSQSTTLPLITSMSV